MGDHENVALWDMDPQLAAARKVVMTDGKASSTAIQQALGVSFTVAAGLLDRLEQAGVVSAADLSGRRVLLQPGPQASVFDVVEDPNPEPEEGGVRGADAFRRFKETPEDQRVRDNTYLSSAQRMLGFVRGLEGFAEERAELAAQQKDLLSEAKSAGYSKAMLQKAVRLRKQTKGERDFERDELDLYMDAIEAAEAAEGGQG